MRTYELAMGAVSLCLLFGAGSACTPAEPLGVGGGGDCAANPFQCDPLETCWPNEDLTKFICISSRMDKKIGDPCDFFGGQVTCPSGSVCIVQGASVGVCTPYCDPEHGHDCPSFAACLKYTIDAPTGTSFTLHACDAVTIGGTTTSSSASGG